MKLLINYANALYRLSQDLNSRTGLDTAGFDKVFSYGPKDIDKSFSKKNKGILSQSRGNGYWLWKPYFIKYSLQFLQDGDFLFYCDSGSYFIRSIQPLINICLNTGQDVIVFDTMYVEKYYTKRDAFILLSCDTPQYTDTLQRLSGFILLRKSKYVSDFINTYLEYAQDTRLITDIDNVMGYPNYDGFVEHRHDLSILSLLSKKHVLSSFRDPSQYGLREINAYPNSSYNQLINITRAKNWSYQTKFLRRLKKRVNRIF